MGFYRETCFVSALILAIAAVLFSAEPQQVPERMWHYAIYVPVFLLLTGPMSEQLLDASDADPGFSVKIGIVLTVAGWHLGGTSYRGPEYVTWGYALGFLVVAPAVFWGRKRLRQRREPAPPPASAPPPPPDESLEPAYERHPLYRAGEILIICTIAAGMVMALSYVTHYEGLKGGAIAAVVWPVTLLITPWHALFQHQEWILLAVIYGGGGLGWLLKRIAEKRARG